MAAEPQNITEDIPAEDESGKRVKPKFDVLQPFDPVEVILLDKEQSLKGTSDKDSEPDGALGERLPAFSFTARPSATPPGTGMAGLIETTKNKPSVVFLPDERYTFADSRFPWSLVGKIRTASGSASGVVVGPRHVLTVSHAINWRRDSAGRIGWATFTPAYYDGRGPWGEFAARQIVA